MEQELAEKIYQEIRNNLLSSRIIKRYRFNQDRMEYLLRDDSFTEKLIHMISRRDYSCSAALGICRGLLIELSGGKQPDNWLDYVYNYALSKSFPDAVQITLKPEFEKASVVYLEFLRVISEYQKSSADGTFQSTYPFETLTPKEEEQLENADEYRRFRVSFRNDYIYEMMKLNQEVAGYTTLDHICGVHYLAMRVARQLKQLGFEIDLGRVSGAAAGHDIGKYGCKPEEAKRVAYFHYYYTDEWFKAREITYIRNVAVNHSTWDLEFENLPIEALILIYSDFCVKAPRDSRYPFNMQFYDLAESFDVILEKLDNVDAAKEKRYRRVYAKLRDFEDFMKYHGVEVDVHKPILTLSRRDPEERHFSLLQGGVLTETLKYQAFKHNIKLLYTLRDESSLNAVLENARSLKQVSGLRGYIFVLEEYSMYLTAKQKMTTLNFLYEMLVHPEEDIRKQCAELMGQLLANFDEDYRKELPKDVVLKLQDISAMDLLKKYLELFLYPDQKVTPKHARWIGHNLAYLIRSLFSHGKEQAKPIYVQAILDQYQTGTEDRDRTGYLLSTVKVLPLDICHDAAVVFLVNYVVKALEDPDPELRLQGLDAFLSLGKRMNPQLRQQLQLGALLERELQLPGSPAIRNIRLKIARVLELDPELIDRLRQDADRDFDEVSELFLSNLKAATSEQVKMQQIQILYRHSVEKKAEERFYTAMHFCNLLKVSAFETVRNYAGETLVRLNGHLSFEQRNDIVVELWKALEIERYQFTKYIPDYLGQIILQLHEKEIEEILDDLHDKMKKASPQICMLILKTLGVALVHYQLIVSREGRELPERFLKRIAGILLNGLAHYDSEVHRTAVSVFGRDIFGTPLLTLEEKEPLYQLVAKKLLAITGLVEEDSELTFLSYAAALNHLYRFIADYSHFTGVLVLPVPERIAFFPGAFDPFSLAHKESAREIRDMGFEVYLYVDEFSWSKRTQPNIIRRQIIKMSIAEEFGLFTYPRGLVVNIANPTDLKALKNNFPEADVHIVVGSDVIANASAYSSQEDDEGIRSFSHIVFERLASLGVQETERLETRLAGITRSVIRMNLSDKYETISSTQIRNLIDQNRDISDLIDPLVMKFIYERGLYRREPQFKQVLMTKALSVDIHSELSEELLREVCELSRIRYDKMVAILSDAKYEHSTRILTIRSHEREGVLLGFSLFHWLRASNIYKEFKNQAICDYIYSQSMGRIIVIDGLYIHPDHHLDNLEQMLLTETLAACIAKDYTYTIYRNLLSRRMTPQLKEVLELQGFIEIADDEEHQSVYAVNMSSPCTLIFDARAAIKDPYRQEFLMVRAFQRTRKRLQQALTELYPGNLVLSFDRTMMYEHLIKKICDENGVSTIPTEPRQLGPLMCVPYGDIFKRWILPNTVTKAFHTERYYTPDAKRYQVEAYPHYLNIDTQVDTFKSFNRQLILVDDLLDKGYRLQAIQQVLQKKGVEVKKIIVAILSGRGKSMIEGENREVDSAYFIPRLRVWFNESHLYPFIGGDTLWRGHSNEISILPSVNLIMPYTWPSYIKGASRESIFKLSVVSLENAIEIMEALEEVYLMAHERNLTLAQLGDVMISPRYPDRGNDLMYDLSKKPSAYLKYDLEALMRFKNAYIEK